MYLESSGFN